MKLQESRQGGRDIISLVWIPGDTGQKENDRRIQ